MASNWPPSGYSEPKEYQRNEMHILLILVLITVGVFSVAGGKVREGASVFVDWWLNFLISTGPMSSPVLSAGLGVLVLVVTLLAIWKAVVVPIHEGIHYSLGLLLDMNPQFRYDDGFIGQNPAVVALSVNIPIWKNFVMLGGPFLFIGTISAGIALLTDGILAGVAAVIFMSNSGGSAQDIYHEVRLLRIDSEARFANFEKDGEIRTEYAVPRNRE